MSISIVYTRAQVGVQAPRVSVETHLSSGLPAFNIVGLPETAVKESRERVRSALLNSGFDFPMRRITINLAPADLPKQGGRYDLAIAVGVLAASGQIPIEVLAHSEFVGELALTGEIRAVTGVLPTALACAREGCALFSAVECTEELELANSDQLYVARHLNQLCEHLHGQQLLTPLTVGTQAHIRARHPDLADVKGQFQARRALEIAAAGRHNLLMFGPPGTGKSMLAERLPGILPPLTQAEAVEVASIYSLLGNRRDRHGLYAVPYRSPHHTASSVALVGGGSQPLPGEISMAHCGVLFLDELPEFDRRVLEVLREPMEKGEICISRARSAVTFPARFQVVAAMNPCPCGFSGHPKIQCKDTPQQIAQYRRKLSGPLLDRFDIHVEVAFQNAAVLLEQSSEMEGSEAVFERVSRARETQLLRQGKLNNQLSGNELKRWCAIPDSARILLERAMDAMSLSARAAHRIVRVSRTLADLAGVERIEQQHVLQALSYRGVMMQ